MPTNSVSRRDILKTLGIGAIASSVLRVIPAHAAEYAHHMVAAEKADSSASTYTPKFFSPRDYKTLQDSVPDHSFPPTANAVARSNRRAGVHRSGYQRES